MLQFPPRLRPHSHRIPVQVRDGRAVRAPEAAIPILRLVGALLPRAVPLADRDVFARRVPFGARPALAASRRGRAAFDLSLLVCSALPGYHCVWSRWLQNRSLCGREGVPSATQ